MKKFLSLFLLLLFLPIVGFQSVEIKPKKVETVITAHEVTPDFVLVKASYYNAVTSQCDETPLVTASGAVIDTVNATELKWCAISYNLHRRYGGQLEFGDVVQLEGYQGKHKIKGKYIVQDLMNPKWQNKIDILRTEGDRGVNYDSVKLKHKKIREGNLKRQANRLERKQEFKAQAKKLERKVERQIIHNTFQKLLSRIPFIGTNNYQADNKKSKPIIAFWQVDNSDVLHKKLNLRIYTSAPVFYSDNPLMQKRS